MIRYKCGVCGQDMEAEAELVGTWQTCTTCGGSLTVPIPEPTREVGIEPVVLRPARVDSVPAVSPPSPVGPGPETFPPPPPISFSPLRDDPGSTAVTPPPVSGPSGADPPVFVNPPAQLGPGGLPPAMPGQTSPSTEAMIGSARAAGANSKQKKGWGNIVGGGVLIVMGLSGWFGGSIFTGDADIIDMGFDMLGIGMIVWGVIQLATSSGE